MIYQYRCSMCQMEIERTCRMSEHTRSIICACGGTAPQIINFAPAVAMTPDWSAENGGRGIWNGQVNEYVKSPAHLQERGRHQGMKKA